MKIEKSLVLIIVGLFALGLSSPFVVGQEGPTSELKNLHLYMISGNSLNPEIPGEGQVVHVQANRDDYGVVLMNRDWTDIGTWTSNPLAYMMDISGNAEFILWCALTDGRSQNDCMFRFTIKQNGQTIGSIEIQDQTVNEEPTMITASSGINATNFESNDQISIYLEYNGWDNMDVYYDNMTHNSGVTLNINPLNIYGTSSSTTEISLEFTDSFDIDWISNAMTGVLVGGQPLEVDPELREGQERQSDNGTVTTKLLVWTSDVKLEKGTSIKVGLSYDGSNVTWETSGTVGQSTIDGGGSVGGDDDDNNNIIFIGAGIGAVVVVIVAVIFIKKRRD